MVGYNKRMVLVRRITARVNYSSKEPGEAANERPQRSTPLLGIERGRGHRAGEKSETLTK